MRKTRIVATLGPASLDRTTLRDLFHAGVDIFRLNFSHGTRDSHHAACELIRELRQETGRDVAILQDLCGPKIRCGEIENGAAELVVDTEVVITTRAMTGTSLRFSCSYTGLPTDVRAGDAILLDDGLLELRVLSTNDCEVRCQVIHGGALKSHKGINLPSTPISAPSVTAKDIRDLVVGIEEEVDFIALSFVRHQDDVLRVRKMLDKHGCGAHIIAKIEKPEALEHIDAILEAADGIMVARGDLGVEVPAQTVPVIQKDLIHRANAADKYVITATQMLESMIVNPRPTRAEVSDVANAIFDGTDAVMLSGESAAGAYPVEAVQMMHNIAEETEAYLIDHSAHWDWRRINPLHPIGDAVGNAAYKLYQDLGIKAIVAFSATGNTATFLSKSRPFAPLIVFTPSRDVARRLRMLWGVRAVHCAEIHSKQDLRYYADEYLREHSLCRAQDNILLIHGTPFGKADCTNSIEVVQLAGTATALTPTPSAPPAETPKPRRRRRKKKA